ncbi:hypothetical protein [Dactylosporangium sp. NPDC005555]|uniref:hypothetical protein n=1 Tax=Dactylosporangium sp. NPDC005555 TaxID=3154889 RepID=UPI0033A51EF3
MRPNDGVLTPRWAVRRSPACTGGGLTGWNHAVLATAACSLAGALLVVCTRDRAAAGLAHRPLAPAVAAR